jgi:hypothetical protein
MLGIKEAKMLLSQLGMNIQDTEKFGLLLEPHIEFHKFLMVKLDINSEDSEKLTENYSRQYIIKKITTLQQEGKKIEELTETDYFSMAGEALKSFANEHGYDTDKSDVLEKNLIELSILLVDITKDLTNKGLLK